jgi:hypothetical protein
MTTTSRVAGALVAGYVLGRFKKLRLALIVGSALANDDVRSKGLGMLAQGGKGLTATPEARKLTQQISTQLVEAGKTAAVSVAASRIDKFSDSLRQRTSNLQGSGQQDEQDEQDQGQQDQQDEQQDSQQDEQQDSQQDGGAEDEYEDEGDEQDDQQDDQQDEGAEDEYEDEGDEGDQQDDQQDGGSQDEGPEDEAEDQGDQADEADQSDEDQPPPPKRSPRRSRAAAPAGR